MKRKVYLKHVRQNGLNCGQACIAMVTGKTLQQIIRYVGSADGLQAGYIAQIVSELGLQTVKKDIYRSFDRHDGLKIPLEEIPDNCLLLTHGSSSDTRHMLVCHNNMIFDPATNHRLPVPMPCKKLECSKVIIGYLEFKVKGIVRKYIPINEDIEAMRFAVKCAVAAGHESSLVGYWDQ